MMEWWDRVNHSLPVLLSLSPRALGMTQEPYSLCLHLHSTPYSKDNVHHTADVQKHCPPKVS